MQEDRALTKGQAALIRANNSGDYVLLFITFLILFLITSTYFIVGYIASPDTPVARDPLSFTLGLLMALFFGGMLFVAILLIGMFLVRMMRQTVLGNSLQIEYSDFAWLRDWANVVAADIQEHGGEAPDVPRIVAHDHAAEVRALLPEITDTDARERAEASVDYAVRSIESRDGLLLTTIPSGLILAGVAASAVGSRRKKLKDGHVGQEAAPVETSRDAKRISFHDDNGPEYID